MIEQTQALLFGYQQIIEKKIAEEIENFGVPNQLKQAVVYTLTNGGKRFRPTLVLMIAKALGCGADATYAALSVEFSHTSSLIADDLPCMDNDDFRRNMPSAHKVFGESTALLASYTLLAFAYQYLALNARVLARSDQPYAKRAEEICCLALENVTYNAGLDRLMEGQFLDINPPDASYKTLRKVLIKKTVSLFEVSFVLGWLYGGGNPKHLPQVKKVAKHFGLAFQIVDDFGDINQDIANERVMNTVIILGTERALQMLADEVGAYREAVMALEWNPTELLCLADVLTVQTQLAAH